MKKKNESVQTLYNDTGEQREVNKERGREKPAEKHCHEQKVITTVLS